MSLSRVGVTNVEKVTRIGPRGAEQLYYAKLDCFVDLGPDQKGAHMSRFEEVINDVIGEVVLGEGGFKAEQLAQRIAVEVRERQGARRAEVTGRGPLSGAQARARCPGSPPRRSTRCWARRSPPSAARAGSWASPPRG